MIIIRRTDTNKHRIMGRLTAGDLNLHTKESGRYPVPAGIYDLSIEHSERYGRLLPRVTGNNQDFWLMCDNSWDELFGDILIGFDRTFDSLTACPVGAIRLNAWIKKTGCRQVTIK